MKTNGAYLPPFRHNRLHRIREIQPVKTGQTADNKL